MFPRSPGVPRGRLEAFRTGRIALPKHPDSGEVIMTWELLLSLIFAVTLPVIVIAGIVQRVKAEKGIGWQFIRYNTVTMALPIVAILALNNALTSEAAIIISGALGYAFGKEGKPDR